MSKWIMGPVAALAAVTLAGAARAEEPQPQLISGKVQSVTATELTISSQGLNMSFVVTPQTVIMTSRPGTLADIKPGSFIGTTNTPTGPGAGKSTEVHIFPQGVRMGEGDRPMGTQAAGSRMTNGTVSSTAAGQDASRMTNGSVGGVARTGTSITMEVAYAGGKRTVEVTDKTPIVVLTSIKATALKPGANVLVGAVPGPGSQKTAQFVNVQP